MSSLSADIVVSDITIPTDDGAIPGFRAMPATGGPFPTVLSVSEIWGVRYHVRDICIALAKAGYFAVAPELFTRQGDVYAFKEAEPLLKSVISKKTDADVHRDLDATMAWIGTTGQADMQRIGINGYCYGGRQVWLYLACSRAFSAAVSWYGGPLAATPTLACPRNPMDVAAEIETPTLGIFGDRDHVINNESIADFRRKLTAAEKTFEFVVYPGAPHSFAAEAGPHYHERETADGWQRMLAWLRQHGVG